MSPPEPRTPPPDYDFWLFDLDGTLVDVEESYRRETLDRVGASLGCSFSDREALVLWHSSDTFRQRVLERHNVDVRTFWEAFDDVDDPIARAEASYLFEDAETINRFDHPTGIVTHCPPSVTETVLENLDITDWFDTVICCTDETGWKPDATPVHMAIQNLLIDDGHNGVFVGDSPDDIGAAWNTGLDGVYIDRYGAHQRGFCVIGDRRVTNLTELQ